MSHLSHFGVGSLLLFSACSAPMSTALSSSNPLLSEYGTPYDVPPFASIKTEHYMPAVQFGISEHLDEIDAIINNSTAATFPNTIEALEFSGATLDRVSTVFYMLNAVITDDEMQALAREFSPLLSAHYDSIILNADLFARVQAVWDMRESLDLSIEESTLLHDTYDQFVRSGALLNDAQKEEMTQINLRLSQLSLEFGENVLAETNKFELIIEDEAELRGLPSTSVGAAKADAEAKGYDGKWLFTIHKPSLIPFLQFSEMRAYREILYSAYMNKGDNGDELDNNAIAAWMASLRVKRANLLGFESHADFVLVNNMAQKPERVYELLNQLWTPALAKAKVEAAEFQAMIDADGGNFQLQPWDWWFYAEKVKMARFNLSEDELRPYFEVERVVQGAFDVANKLWGLTFVERTDIPKYHDEVRTFEVKDKDGSHLAIYLVDYFPRESKRSGAFMNSFRKQSNVNGLAVTPIIYNVGNFTKPTADTPALITFEEAKTLFHEFGHALHGFLSDVTYNSLSGTAVPRDFVEVFSAVMENWAADPSVIKSYALHYETGEPIPDELIAKIEAAGTFNQGFATTELIAASILDMDWHTLTDTTLQNTSEFETASMAKIGLIPEILSRYRSQHFRHIFNGGYASGYYGYLWAEVIDADAFEAFKETGDIFDQATAQSLRDNVLSRGGTEDPMTLYLRFRGREPEIGPLLKRRGLD